VQDSQYSKRGRVGLENHKIGSPNSIEEEDRPFGEVRSLVPEARIFGKLPAGGQNVILNPIGRLRVLGRYESPNFEKVCLGGRCK